MIGLESQQECREISTEVRAEVASFLYQHGRQSEPGDCRGDSPKTVRRDLEPAQGVALVRIEPQRDDQRRGARGADALQGDVKALEICRIAEPARQRQVEVRADPVPRARFTRISPIKRIKG